MSTREIEEYEKHLINDPYNNAKKLLPDDLRFFNNPSVSSIEIKDRFINLKTDEQKVIQYYYLRSYGSMDRYEKILGLDKHVQIEPNDHRKSIKSVVNEYLGNIKSEHVVYLPKDITLLELFSIYESATPISIDTYNTHIIHQMFTHFITLGQEYTVYKIGRATTNQKKLGDSIELITELTKFLQNNFLTKELNKLTAYAISDSALLKSYEHRIQKSIYFYMKVFIANQQQIDIHDIWDIKLNKKNIKAIVKSFSNNIRLIES